MEFRGPKYYLFFKWFGDWKHREFTSRVECDQHLDTLMERDGSKHSLRESFVICGAKYNVKAKHIVTKYTVEE